MFSDVTNFEQQSFEQDALWEETNITNADRERIEVLSARIPKDVKTILDIGCGGGIFINFLASQGNRFQRICGVDRSPTALKHVKTENKLANIDCLPFEDKTFDMVSCLEVIEHLPIPIYENALKEICRISKKYVLISVPNAEDLANSLVQCPLCKTQFHPSYHAKSFNPQMLQNLLKKYNFHSLDIFNIHQQYIYIGIYRIRKMLFPNKNIPPWYSICPICGYQIESPTKINPTNANKMKYDMKNLIKSTILYFWPKRKKYCWLGGIYISNTTY